MMLPAIEVRQGELALSALPYPSVVSLVYLTNGRVAWSIIGGTRLPRCTGITITARLRDGGLSVPVMGLKEQGYLTHEIQEPSFHNQWPGSLVDRRQRDRPPLSLWDLFPSSGMDNHSRQLLEEGNVPDVGGDQDG